MPDQNINTTRFHLNGVQKQNRWLLLEAIRVMVVVVMSETAWGTFRTYCFVSWVIKNYVHLYTKIEPDNSLNHLRNIKHIHTL